MSLNESVGQTGGSESVIRLVPPSVVVLCGPAACGKSTFAARHFRPTQVISSDRCRALVCDDEQDQRFQAQAFALLDFLVEQRLGINRLCVVDSTALTREARQSLLELARGYRVPCVLFLFETPLAVCVARDAGRERSVGQPVVERQYQMFEQAKASIAQEGFDQIVELRDEELDKARIEIVFRPAPRVAPGSPSPEGRRLAPRPGQPAQSGAPRPPQGASPSPGRTGTGKPSAESGGSAQSGDAPGPPSEKKP
jgi:protein phosphatase